ncbi:MAG: DUF6969 family protein [Panacagrimonas sp.]
MVARLSLRMDRALSGESRGSVQRAAEGLAVLMEATRRLALERQGLLAEVVAGRSLVRALDHFPVDDAHDARTGYRWYYHCHPREARTAGEHGHFHLFSDPHSGQAVTHLITISVSDRGLPLGLFTTNRWVTDERWQSATRILHLIRDFALASPKQLHLVHQWLAHVLRAFAPQIRVLLFMRDERLDALRVSARSDVLEDRRIAVLSRCGIDLFAQAAALDRRLPPAVIT